MVATFITEGWVYQAQHLFAHLKIKALLNNHSKTQERNYSGMTNLRCFIVSFKNKTNQMSYLEHPEHLSLLRLTLGCGLWSHRQMADLGRLKPLTRQVLLEQEAQTIEKSLGMPSAV